MFTHTIIFTECRTWCWFHSEIQFQICSFCLYTISLKYINYMQALWLHFCTCSYLVYLVQFLPIFHAEKESARNSSHAIYICMVKDNYKGTFYINVCTVCVAISIYKLVLPWTQRKCMQTHNYKLLWWWNLHLVCKLCKKLLAQRLKLNNTQICIIVHNNTYVILNCASICHPNIDSIWIYKNNPLNL